MIAVEEVNPSSYLVETSLELDLPTKNDDRMHVISQKGRLDASKHCVEDDTDWKEEASSSSGHTSEVTYHGRSASQQHRSH